MRTMHLFISHGAMGRILTMTKDIQTYDMQLCVLSGETEFAILILGQL